MTTCYALQRILLMAIIMSWSVAMVPALRAAPFRIVVLGDSILWGQGHREGEKIHDRVKQLLQDCSGIGSIEVEHLARSGAIIGTASDIDSNSGITTQGYYSREIPDRYPTVLRQCRDFNTFPPDSVNLVIVNGGANDVGGDQVVHPFVPASCISADVEEYCHRRMTNLLEQVSAKFVNATIVVSGYYPIVSSDTPLASITTICAGLYLIGTDGFWSRPPCSTNSPGVLGIVTPDIQATMVAKSAMWAAESTAKLKLAVNEANAVNGRLNRGNRISFADPRFRSENALYGSQTWLFALWPNFEPQDFVITERDSRCAEQYPRPANELEFSGCRRASMYHPDTKGEQAYADAIFAAYLNTDGLVWMEFNALCQPLQRCGTKWTPFGTLAAARDGVPAGGTIAIRSGSTSETITIDKACRLQACAGPVTIGR